MEQQPHSTEHSEHHHHHSTEHSEHRHHHHHHRRRRKSKSGRSAKKSRYLLLNVLFLMVAITVCVVAILVKIPTPGGKAPVGGASSVESLGVGDATIQLELPFFKSDVYLIEKRLQGYLNREHAEIKEYKKEDERLDKGLPVTLAFRVNGLPPEYTVASSQIDVSEDPAFTAPQTYKLKRDENRAEVYHLKTNTRYYYRVTATLSNGATLSAQSEFHTADTPRILSIDGAVNVRDIGGWKTTDGKTVRQGLLYRGSELDGASEKDFCITPKGLSTMLDTLGIRTDLDLRSELANPNGTDALGASVEHIYFDALHYTDIFSEYGEFVVKRLFTRLAEESCYPAYLHCAYGMDRTGTMCFLLGALLGVREEDLLREYRLSELYYGWADNGMIKSFANKLSEREGDTLKDKAESFVLSTGVTKEQIESIREIFLAE
ncbi:MAG: tyrosine-protein phosphatase [Clostridia bacterium]|nr:tyrosine-protein phosphatase [Clostridia bacterium]